MVFVETPIFTRLVVELLPDDEFRLLQLWLLLRPDQGALIPGAHGLRKLRWGFSGRGKRSGLRVLYYWDPEPERIYMIYIYVKTRSADLTRAQIRELGRVVLEDLE